MDTEPESEFNELVSLASELCQAPISLITLLDENRQWFKARKGLSATQTDRSVAFCDKALLQDDIFVVTDAAKDPRFAKNPLVTGDPNIRFYAGALVHSPEGHKLGTLCIIDTEPRELSWREANILSKLARQATHLIELRSRRREMARLQDERRAQNEALELQQFRYQRLSHLAWLQTESMAAFLDNGMDALQSGRFTKKEIAEVVEKAAAHRAQAAAFNEALRLLARYNQPTETQELPPVRIPDLLSELFTGLAPLVKSSGNRVQPLIPADLSLRQDPEFLRCVFRILLSALLGAVRNADISLVVKDQPQGIDVTVHIPEHNLVDALQRYMPDAPALGAEHLSGLPFHVELALVKDLIIAAGGRKTLQKLGNRGTAIEFFLPHAG
ncbi:hypothetical protein GCM10028786_34290 [Flaviaesturariibacter terrae]